MGIQYRNNHVNGGIVYLTGSNGIQTSTVLITKVCPSPNGGYVALKEVIDRRFFLNREDIDNPVIGVTETLRAARGKARKYAKSILNR